MMKPSLKGSMYLVGEGKVIGLEWGWGFGGGKGGGV